MKSILATPLAALYLAATLISTAQASPASEAIDAVNGQFENGFAQGDASMIADVYTSAGELLPPNSPSISGYENIVSFWQGVIDMGIKRAELDTVELDEQGDTAIEVGMYTLLGVEDQLIDEGKYIVIWKKDENGWKYHRDMWSSTVSLN